MQVPFGRCRFHHNCSNCEEEHTKANCPFPARLDLVSIPPLLGERGTVLTGKWHLILDLSSPEGQSVNDSIPEPPFTVQYVAVDAFIDGTLG